MSGLSAERRAELAGALCRGLGDAVCLNYDPSVPGGCSRCARDVDALAPLISGWIDAERAARMNLAAVSGYEFGHAEGAAEVRARVEAVLSANERHNSLVETVQLRRRLRAALGGDS